MKLIVDANILFAALIRRNDTFLLLFEDSLDLYAPDYLLEELAEHRDEVLAKTNETPERFDLLFSRISSRIHLIPLKSLKAKEEEAARLSPDADDAPYFALALFLGKEAVIWSNDKRLKTQSQIPVISTAELISRFYHR